MVSRLGWKFDWDWFDIVFIHILLFLYLIRHEIKGTRMPLPLVCGFIVLEPLEGKTSKFSWHSSCGVSDQSHMKRSNIIQSIPLSKRYQLWRWSAGVRRRVADGFPILDCSSYNLVPAAVAPMLLCGCRLWLHRSSLLIAILIKQHGIDINVA